MVPPNSEEDGPKADSVESGGPVQVVSKGSLDAESPSASPQIPPPASSSEPPSAAESITASQSIVTGMQTPRDATGFYRPLPPVGKVARLWSQLGLGLGRRLATVIRDDHVYLIVMAAGVGVVSGGAAGLLLWWIEYAIGLFPQPEEDFALRWTVVIAVPVAGGLIAGALRLVAHRMLEAPPGVGPPAVIEAIALRGGTVRGRGAAVVGAGTGVTIGSGGSCGHEGPSVAIGAAVGSAIARFFGLRMRRHLALVGAGCASGLAAAFNAPLAGVIFTVELVFGGSIGGNVGTMSVFIPLIVAAVAGTFTSHAIYGDRSTFELAAHDSGVSLPDLGFYVLLALLAGVIGSAMTRSVIEARHRFDAQTKIPVWLKPAIGAFFVGLLAALISNDLLGPGHSVVERMLDGSILWRTAAVLLVAKIVVTALTLGSGGFGGVFMPSLVVGACLGTLVGTLAGTALGPQAQPVSVYSLVGMGAIFAAMMHAPLTPIVMLFELTHDYGVILPLMLSCILAVLVARKVHPTSFYKMMLGLRGVVLRHEAEEEVMKRGHVKELMVSVGPVLDEGAGLDEIRRVVMETGLGATFVTDANDSVVGYIDGNQLAAQMLKGAIKPDSTAHHLMGARRLTLMYPHDTLAGAMAAFARSGQDVLPVVDDLRRIIGVLRRGDLIAHYSEKVLGEQQEVVAVRTDEPGMGHEVGLGKGLILERVVVGRAWAGKTLAELELRRKTGVTVLEWLRDDELMNLDPHTPLREGDQMALCGGRDQILKMRRLW